MSNKTYTKIEDTIIKATDQFRLLEDKSRNWRNCRGMAGLITLDEFAEYRRPVARRQRGNKKVKVQKLSRTNKKT